MFDAPERLALEYAERVTHTEQDVDDALFARAQAKFGAAGVVELTALIGFENFSSKFNHTLDIADQHLCPLPRVTLEQGPS